ncbi:hypothetical protein H311_03898, partial [Anncaliia algerae PRA109]
FSKRKFNDDRAVKSSWIIGGVDINTREFFALVIKRDKETLNKILLESIKLENTIAIDCLKRYLDLNSLGFVHINVNHLKKFINPLTRANIQANENRWSVYKRKYRAR